MVPGVWMHVYILDMEARGRSLTTECTYALIGFTKSFHAKCRYPCVIDLHGFGPNLSEKFNLNIPSIAIRCFEVLADNSRGFRVFQL